MQRRKELILVSVAGEQDTQTQSDVGPQTYAVAIPPQ